MAAVATPEEEVAWREQINYMTDPGKLTSEARAALERRSAELQAKLTSSAAKAKAEPAPSKAEPAT